MNAHSATEVLVVDDDADIRTLVAAVLQDEGYHVLTAPDGEPALQHLREHSHGVVVLLDLLMPGMDGYQLLQALTADPPLATRHRVILMSAIPLTLQPKVAELLRDLGIEALPKPFDLDQLIETVHQAARRLRQRAAQPSQRVTPSWVQGRLHTVTAETGRAT